MALGQAQSSKFQIGSAELRIGTLNNAMRLNSNRAMGLLQSCQVQFQQDSVDLEGGLPKTLVDTAIVRTNVTVNAQAYEYSRRNIRVMLNEGAEDVGKTKEYGGTAMLPTVGAGSQAQEADAAFGTVGNLIDTYYADSDRRAGTIPFFSDADNTGHGYLFFSGPKNNLEVEDVMIVHLKLQPEYVSSVRVVDKYVNSTHTDGSFTCVKIALDETPFTFDIYEGTPMYNANQVGLGTQQKTNYFSCSVLGLEHSTARPIGFHFWKAAVSGGMTYDFTADNFAVTPITFKILQPTADDIATGGALRHLRNIIPTNPYGMYFSG